MRIKPLTLEKLLIALVGFKFLYLFCRVFAPFSLPHVFRQTDTMSVSLRYFSRWFLESEQHLLWAPAVLTSGDKYGLVGMEFPFLNILTAWPFVLDIYWARGFAFAIYLFCVLYLTFINFRKWHHIQWQGINLNLAILVYCLLGLSSTYLGKFMPDCLAFSFVVLSIPYFIEKKYFKFVVFLVLGCLIKPTAIATLSILILLMPFYELIKRSFWILGSVGLVLIWYKIVVPYVIQQSDVEQLFYIQLASPMTALVDSLKSSPQVLDLVGKKILPLYMMFLGLVFCFIGSQKKAFRRLFTVMGLNLLFVFMLAGPTTFVHDYYHMGASLLSAVVFLCLMRQHKILQFILLFIVCVRLVEGGIHELKHYGALRNHYSDCEQILRDYPDLRKELRVVSSKEPFPKIGLCLGKIQNALDAQYGVFYLNDTMPETCSLLKSYSIFKVAKCGFSR